MKKRALAVTLCAALTAGLLSVTAFADGSTEFANDKFNGKSQEFLDTLAGLIEENTGVSVEWGNYPDVASYQTYIQQTIRDSAGPGLMTWWSGSQYEALANEGLLEDLTGMWDEYFVPQGVPQAARDALTIDGKCYASPYAIIYTELYYNMDCYAKAGIEKLPESFDEFLEVCDKLLAAGITPIGLKDDSWGGFLWFEIILCMKDPQLYQDVCSGAKAYTDPEVVEVMTVWKDMIDKGYFTKPLNYQDMEQMMATGQLAMIFDDNAYVTRLVNEFGMESGVNLGAYSIPTGGDKKVIFYEVSPLMVVSASADKDNALECLKNYYTTEVQQYFFDDTGYFTTSNIVTEDPIFSELLEHVADTENYQLFLRYYENTPSELRDTVLDELMKFELGNSTVDEFCSACQKKADEIFGN